MKDEGSAKPAVRTGSFWRTIRAVAWSFLGVRKSSEYQEDMAKLNLFHIIAVAIVGVLIFVVSLVALVNWVVAK